MNGDDLARRRWLALMMIRLVGTGMAAVGALILAGRLAEPPVVGGVLLVVGGLDALFMPVYLARKWRSGR